MVPGPYNVDGRFDNIKGHKIFALYRIWIYIIIPKWTHKFFWSK